jgi:hypothetical protein
VRGPINRKRVFRRKIRQKTLLRIRERPDGAFSKSVSHASLPSDRSNKLLAAQDVIDENHPASNLSLGKDAGLRTRAPKIKKFFDGFFLENPSYLLGDLNGLQIVRERDRCSLRQETLQINCEHQIT